MNKILKNTRWTKILFHTVAWLIVFSLPYLLRPYNPNNPRNPDENNFFYLTSITNFFWMVLFYVNSSILIKHFLYKKRYAAYVAILIAAFGIIIACHGMVFVSLISTRNFRFQASAGFNLSAFLLTVAASIIYRMFLDNARTARIAQAKQEENLKSELYFLRSQISPHFIFNVLNNIVALARMKSDQLEPTVMKLSSLMQYMLYETDEEKVTLQTEAEYLRSYVDLQRQRFGEKVKVNLELDILDGTIYLEPMLLIPFVENAFKHGVGMIEQPEINIRLHTNEKVLEFTVQNKFAAKSTETKDKTSGIGLPNVTRRLNLLYPGQHDLMITKNESWFSTALKLNLH